MIKRRINYKWVLGGFGISLIIIVSIVGLVWLAKCFPMKPDTKDWLDIMSAIGQAAGVVVLVGLIMELSRLRTDVIAKQTPDIRITAEIVDMNTVPQGHVCLTETAQPFSHLHPSDGNYQTDYVEAWRSLDNQKSSHFISIRVVNKSINREAIAKDFKSGLN